MARAQSKSTVTGVFDSAKRFGSDLQSLGRDVLLAGFGVIATAESQSRAVFDGLVAAGREYEQDETRLYNRATRGVTDLGKMVEHRVRSGITSTLTRVGVPSHEEIQKLTRRVEALTRRLEVQ